MLKKEIESAFVKGDIELADRLIKEYEKGFPFDIDVCSMKVNISLMREDYEKAYDYAKMALDKLPLNADIQYNYACVCELLGDYYEAIIHYNRAMVILRYNNEEERIKELNIEEQCNDLMIRYSDVIFAEQNKDQLENNLKYIENLNMLLDNSYTMSNKCYTSYMKVIGKEFLENEYRRRYIGIFNDQYHMLNDGELDLINVKGEFIETDKGNRYIVDDEGEYYIPIASSERANAIGFTNGENTIYVPQIHPRHFDYYKISGPTTINTTKQSYFGKPIRIQNDKDKKRLVLNIFVDGLSYMILQNNQFAENMPNTYEFFSKGTIFENAYSSAEWTYPSIINTVTGMNTTEHMVFHNNLDYAMPDSVETLAENFKKQGYYTAMFNGDWRIVPSYGHARGGVRI